MVVGWWYGQTWFCSCDVGILSLFGNSRNKTTKHLESLQRLGIVSKHSLVSSCLSGGAKNVRHWRSEQSMRRNVRKMLLFCDNSVLQPQLRLRLQLQLRLRHHQHQSSKIVLRIFPYCSFEWKIPPKCSKTNWICARKYQVKISYGQSEGSAQKMMTSQRAKPKNIEWGQNRLFLNESAEPKQRDIQRKL